MAHFMTSISNFSFYDLGLKDFGEAEVCSLL